MNFAVCSEISRFDFDILCYDMQKNDKTLRDLATGLIAISRLDCVGVIEKWNPNATMRLASGVSKFFIILLAVFK